MRKSRVGRVDADGGPAEEVALGDRRSDHCDEHREHGSEADQQQLPVAVGYGVVDDDLGEHRYRELETRGDEGERDGPGDGKPVRPEELEQPAVIGPVLPISSNAGVGDSSAA